MSDIRQGTLEPMPGEREPNPRGPRLRGSDDRAVTAGPAHAEPEQGSGRRRESSRHRSSRRIPLPGWLAWLLRSGTPLVSLVPALVAVVVVQSLSPAAQAVPTGSGRFALAGGWLATAPGALSGYTHWWDAPPVGWAQLGLLIRALQGAAGHSVLAAAHGGMLALAIVQVALVWLLARRIGTSALAAGAAAAAFGVAPIAVVAHSAPSTAGVATVWLLLAAVLGTGTARTTTVLAGATAGLAVVSDLIALPAVLALVWSSLAAPRPGRRRTGETVPPGPRSRLLLIASGFAVVVLGAVAAVVELGAASPTAAANALSEVGAAAVAAGEPSAGGAAAIRWLTVDPLSLLLTLVALVLLVQRPRARPIVVLAAVLALLGSWPLGSEQVAPIVALLPIAALAIALVIDRAVVALGDAAFQRSALGSGWLMAVAALLVVSALVWIGGIGSLQRRDDQPIARAQQWLHESVPAGQLVLVDLAAWPDLARGASADVAWYAATQGGASVPSSAPWARADYVLSDAALRSDAHGAAASTLRRSLSVAGFGSGDASVEVRAVRAHPTVAPTAPSAPTEAERRAAAARRLVGAQLAENPRITLSGPDRAALLAGEVDSRVAIVLAQFVTTHRVTVSGFPLVTQDTGATPGGVRRQVLISAVDGRRIPADAGRTGELLRFLSSLRGEFATSMIDARDTGVLATFTADPTFVPAS